MFISYVLLTALYATLRMVAVATKFSTGEQVWVPSTRLSGDHPYALVTREVLGQEKRSVVVNDGYGDRRRSLARQATVTRPVWSVLTHSG